MQRRFLVHVFLTHRPLLSSIFLPMSFHLQLQLALSLEGSPLIFILRARELVLDLLVLIFEDGLVSLLFQQRLLLVSGLLQAEKLIVRLLIDTHFLCFELLVYLHVELMLLLLGRLSEGLLLDVVLLLEHRIALLKLLIQAAGISLLLLLNRRRARQAFSETLRHNGRSTRCNLRWCE